MDLSVLGGLVVALGAILGANAIDGGSLAALINPSALLLIIGGTLGATAVSSRLEDLLAIPKSVVQVFRPRASALEAQIERLTGLALRARRNGLLSLEEEIASVQDPLLAHGLQLVVDGADAETLRGIMRTQMALEEERRQRQHVVFETAGGFAPTMGIIGTVMGLIHVLANLADAGKLGPSIATAFLATFYGISTANVLWLPIANKLKQNARREELAAEVTLEGVLSIQAGDNPSAVRDKLRVFLHDQRPASGEAEAKPEAKPEGEGSDNRDRVA